MEFAHYQMLGLYAVLKLALIGLTKEIAKEVAEENIRVNCIVAGAFKTKYIEVVRHKLWYILSYCVYLSEHTYCLEHQWSTTM